MLDYDANKSKLTAPVRYEDRHCATPFTGPIDMEAAKSSD